MKRNPSTLAVTMEDRLRVRDRSEDRQQQCEHMFHGSTKLAESKSRFRALACVAPFLFLTLAVSLDGCSDQKSKYAGIWQSSCEDYWGVQIKPLEGGLYSVTFCGLSGCMEPGKWMPNTRIEGDPMYQAVSSKVLRIKRSDRHSFTYIRCSDDPVWPAQSAELPLSQK